MNLRLYRLTKQPGLNRLPNLLDAHPHNIDVTDIGNVDVAIFVDDGLDRYLLLFGCRKEAIRGSLPNIDDQAIADANDDRGFSVYPVTEFV